MLAIFFIDIFALMYTSTIARKLLLSSSIKHIMCLRMYKFVKFIFGILFFLLNDLDNKNINHRSMLIRLKVRQKFHQHNIIYTLWNSVGIQVPTIKNHQVPIYIHTYLLALQKSEFIKFFICCKTIEYRRTIYGLGVKFNMKPLHFPNELLLL